MVIRRTAWTLRHLGAAMIVTLILPLDFVIYSIQLLLSLHYIKLIRL